MMVGSVSPGCGLWDEEVQGRDREEDGVRDGKKELFHDSYIYLRLMFLPPF